MSSDSEASNDIDEKIKKIEEIDEALSQFLLFTKNEENQAIIESLITFNTKVESNKELYRKIEDVENARKIKSENEYNLLIKQKNYYDGCEKSKQLKEDITSMLDFLDEKEPGLYLK